MAVAEQTGDGHAEAHLGAGSRRGVDEHRVEHGAARRVERVDAGARLDGYVDAVLGRSGTRGPHRRRAGGDDPVEQAPAGKLQHAAAHQGVGREGVGAVAAAVDHEDTQARAGPAASRWRLRRAGADDDDVVGRSVQRLSCGRARAGSA